MTSTHQHPTKQPYATPQAPTDRFQESACCLRRVGSRLFPAQSSLGASNRVYSPLPRISRERRDASLSEKPLEWEKAPVPDIPAVQGKEKTVLYLAYGSNLCEETFKGARGIRPLSQINVVVPSLRLTFDLPGIPYSEPCFANTAARDPDARARDNGVDGTDYHKDRWHKGLVGCVYEVTQSDYVHIIATEGGGSSYRDILVDCYPLPDSDTVPDIPSTGHFKAHTLFAPAADAKTWSLAHITDRFARPDPSYAQPSARYLGLLTVGAVELGLPAEYQAYLNDIRPYTITSRRQTVGKTLFVGIWLPIITIIFGLNKKFQDDKGRAPKWLAALSAMMFLGMWTSYDVAFKQLFGDGERTEGEDTGEEDAARRGCKIGDSGSDRRWSDARSGEDMV